MSIKILSESLYLGCTGTPFLAKYRCPTRTGKTRRTPVFERCFFLFHFSDTAPTSRLLWIVFSSIRREPPSPLFSFCRFCFLSSAEDLASIKSKWLPFFFFLITQFCLLVILVGFELATTNFNKKHIKLQLFRTTNK